jgi:hypothetical protein
MDFSICHSEVSEEHYKTFDLFLTFLKPLMGVFDTALPGQYCSV